MTKKEAIKMHRSMWNWLAETGREYKFDTPEIQAFPDLFNDCFLCEYSKVCNSGKSHDCCKFCPLEWPEIEQCYGKDWQDGIYDKWLEAENIGERKAIALQIANLPEKGVTD